MSEPRISRKEAILGYLSSAPEGVRGAVIMEALGLPQNFSSGYMKHYVKSGVVEVISTAPKVYRITKAGMAYLGGGQPSSPVKYVPVAEEVPTLVSPSLPVNGQSSLDKAIEALAEALVARVSEAVEYKVEGLIAGVVETQIARSIEKLTAGLKPVGLGMEKPKTDSTRPRVLVGGLLPDQANFISKEFSEVLDLRFLGSNENVQLWKSNASHADAVFIFADKISHMTIRAVESVGVKPIIVKGGMTSLRDALTKYYAEV